MSHDTLYPRPTATTNYLLWGVVGAMGLFLANGDRASRRGCPWDALCPEGCGGDAIPKECVSVKRA